MDSRAEGNAASGQGRTWLLDRLRRGEIRDICGILRGGWMLSARDTEMEVYTF